MAKQRESQRFTVGDAVQVNAVVVKSKDMEYRRLIRVAVDRPRGLVVGARYVFEGIIKSQDNLLFSALSIDSMEPDQEDRESYLEVSNSQWIWLVRFGLLNKPVMVLPADLVKHNIFQDRKLPILDQRHAPCSDLERRILSAQAKGQHRDSKGKFIKVKAKGEADSE